MATLEELIATRINKADELRRQGIEPYPHSYEPTHNTASFLAQYGDKVEAGETLDELVRVAGRVMAVRKSGGRTFIDIEDQHGSVQAVVQRDNVGENNYALLHAVLERGDFIGIEGNVTRTKRNALSVDAQSWTMLTKAVRPLPSKEYTTEEGDRRGGLADPELMYRQPALRFIMDPSARDVMVKRSSAISLMREILERHGYMEVEIPTLQPVYGGASARPFTTRLNALGGMDLYLSISPELYLKRMLVGGFNKGVYTICKNFRNEGIDRTHNPEFTMMECYKAFVDYEWLMRLTENMWEEIFTEVNDSAQVRYAMPKSELGEQVLDFKAPWERRTMCSLVYEHTGLDVANMEEAELRERVQRVYNDGKPYIQSDDYGSLVWGNMVQVLFEAYAEHHLVQPTFVIDHPRESTPLCKGKRGDQRLIERFEPFVYGVEVANAYSELNDPVLQRQLLMEQARMGLMGDEEAHQMDEYFCRAIEYGMPPAGGLGIGVDRLVMFLTGSTTIRDVIAFPFMRPEL